MWTVETRIYCSTSRSVGHQRTVGSLGDYDNKKRRLGSALVYWAAGRRRSC